MTNDWSGRAGEGAPEGDGEWALSMPVRDRPPESFARRVLVAVGGLAPQVITEALYWLACVRVPPFVPTEIRVVTTTVGREQCELALLHPQQGKFHALLRDYGLVGQVAFGSEHFELIRDGLGRALDDVCDGPENVAAADSITAFIRDLAADPDCALHVCISGGRNTMGVYLGYALSLFGRRQDRLSHVMVPPEFTHNHDFYYPPPQPGVLIDRISNRSVSTRAASVTLAEIPFVSLRGLLPSEVLDGVVSYSTAVALTRESMQPHRLVVARASRRLFCGEREVALPPQLFAWYLWLAQRRKSGAEHGGAVRWTDADIAGTFLACYRSVVGIASHDYDTAAEVLRDGMTDTFFAEKKSRVNRALRTALGVDAEAYLIHETGRRPATRFGLLLAPQAIEFRD